MNFPNTKALTSRKEALLNLYQECHDKLPDTEEDLFIINFLDKLKDIYNDNYNAFQECKRNHNEHKTLKQIAQKEEILWKLGIWCQKYLGIYINDYKVGGYDGARGRYCKADGLSVGSRGNSKIVGKGLFQGYQEA
jgi:hypothetical protein